VGQFEFTLDEYLAP